MDPGVHALQYLDVIQMKDAVHKANFYHNLSGNLANIPKVSLGLLNENLMVSG